MKTECIARCNKELSSIVAPQPHSDSCIQCMVHGTVGARSTPQDLEFFLHNNSIIMFMVDSWNVTE